jgi:4-carboxymuconolactone decarboxylase
VVLPGAEEQALEMRRDHEDLLRRLALNDEKTVATALGTVVADVTAAELDAKTHALVRLAALISLESAAASYEWGVSVALAAGASDEEIVDVLVAVAPIVGLTRVNSAASELALALDLEIAEDRL